MEKNKKLAAFILRRAALIVADILFINLAYWIALVVRFYVNGQFRPVAISRYIPAFHTFAPWYTVCAVLIFAAWGLYGNRWKDAGLKDFNRILAANFCTIVAQVAGSIIFVDRMPLTYYFIGAAVRLVLTAAVRFAYRFSVLEYRRLAKKEIVVVGTGLAADHVLSVVFTPVLVDGQEFPAGVEALKAVGEGKEVHSIGVRNGMVEIVTDEKKNRINDTSWAADSEDVSFF